MRNFSSDPNKPSFMSEAPGFVRFFLDQNRPKWQRGGAASVVLIIFLLPLFSSHSSSSRSGEQPSSVRSAATEKQSDEQEKSLSENKNKLPAVDSKAMLSEEPNHGAFRKVPGPFPVLVSIARGSNESVWISSVQDVFEVKAGETSKKLDPSSYENVFNDELPAITASLLDESGELWIGSRTGALLHYANYDWKVVFKAKEPISERIFSLGKKDNSLFLGTASGLWRWDMTSGKVTRFKGFAGQLIQTFANDAEGNLYLAATSGIWKLTDRAWTQVFSSPEGVRITDFSFRTKNEVVIGSSEGLIRFDLQSAQTKRHLGESSVSAVEIDGPGLWVGLESEGLRYFDGERWFGLSETEGLPSGAIAQIFAAGDSSLWIGASGKGAFRANKRELLDWIKKYPIEDVTPDDSKPRLYKNACKAVESEFKKTNMSRDVSAVSIGGETRVFFRGSQVCPSGVGFRSESGGLALLQKNEILLIAGENVQRLKVPDKFPTAEFKKIFLDSSGRIWIARNSGVLMFQNDTWNDGKEDPILNGNVVQAFAEDKDKIFWMGTAPSFNEQTREYTQPSLHGFNGSGWLHRSYEQGVPGYSVTAIIPLRAGGVLVGTPSSFALVNPNKINTPGGRTPFSAPVMSATEDADGALWLVHAFFQKGLSYYDGKAFLKLDVPGQLFSNNFAGIAQDGHGKIWLMSTSGEIGIYAKEYLLSLALQNQAKQSE